MIKVLKAGFYATIQDRGRVGFAGIGVPISGVMDSYSANIANSILDNSLDPAVLEITFGGTQLEFLADSFISISGADFNPTINQKKIKLNTRIQVVKGDVLSFGKINYGTRCYLAVKEGFQTPKILKSRSQYQHITSNFRIQKDDILPVSKSTSHFQESNTSIKINKNHFESPILECFKGPEFYLLSKEQKEKLLTTIFSISSDNNRMGYRLNELIKNNFSSILTSSVLPGTVQLTPSGKLIILLRDCQVTGGYSRILQLTEGAINKLSQKNTNGNINFDLTP